MARPASTRPAESRLGVLERAGGDFPYYNGTPVTITGGRWWIVVASVLVAFAALTTLPLTGAVTGFVPAVLFVAIPLLALHWASHGHWTVLFRRVGVRDVGLMVFYWLLNLVVTFATGAIISAVTDAKANPAAGDIAGLAGGERVLFLIRAAVQLLGEELLTILPFLALLYWLYAKVRVSRRTAVILSWVVTAVAFGALHLPTYDWNVLQAVIGIGVARLVLTAAYLRTKNVWVSTGAHILNDWTFLIGAMT